MLKDKEMVNHPSHYGGEDNPYEAIKVIEAWDLDFCLGNVVKYISRAGKKNKDRLLEDLEKAAWYLNREIDNLKTSKEADGKTFYFCFSKARTLVGLGDFVSEITQLSLPKTHVKCTLCKDKEEVESYMSFYGDGGTDIIIEVKFLSYFKDSGYFLLKVSTGKESKTLPVSTVRLYDYFENAELITRLAE